MTAYDTGSDRWQHGASEHASGRSGGRYLGPCPVCGSRTFMYGGGWRCLDPYCSKSYTNPAPSVGREPDWWNTGINVFRDGNEWCAVGEGFVNIQESPCGFGRTPKQAVEALRLATGSRQ